jgi:hypothetical protein
VQLQFIFVFTTVMVHVFKLCIKIIGHSLVIMYSPYEERARSGEVIVLMRAGTWQNALQATF